MESIHQYYTGADPAYFLAPQQRWKSGLRDLVQFIAGGAIVASAITAGAMALLWQTAAADLTPAEAPVFAQPAPAVYLAVAVPELPLTQHDRRRRQLASA